MDQAAALIGAIWMDTGDPCRDRDLPGEILDIACKPFRYHVLTGQMGRWLPVHGWILNYKGISQQVSRFRYNRAPPTIDLLRPSTAAMRRPRDGNVEV